MKKVDPIFEVSGDDDEYIMVFAPVKNRQDCILEVGNDIKIPLTNKKWFVLAANGSFFE
ncbi:hypothetical protein IOC57_25340 [Bacillus sp. SD075]|uniref:hypothetical protein n=1 Tax=Bacillus sp. SD075 TaxID=2781732 RepID=UPI001A97D152|nr:hypothetical protein [Bacillus sp. SD075]MBO1001034.1 hypothetical protein [Bacillus sp. SD075]